MTSQPSAPPEVSVAEETDRITKVYKSNAYVNQFLALKCVSDIMISCFPIGNKPTKEITESMAIIRRLRRIALPDPMKYTLYDFCAGNALTSIIACYLLPIKEAYAIDKRERKRRFNLTDRFYYLHEDIYKFDPSTIKKDSVIIAVHACASLANRVIDIYKQSAAEHLILMPCCMGKITKTIPPAIQSIVQNKYAVWTWQLAEKVNGRFNFDDNCISPKNGVIVASKEK